MSKKSPPKVDRVQIPPPKIDSRAQRTRSSLNDALMKLGTAGDVDSLDVGELAETAGVGRSTFYAHFANKSDFLISSFAGMIGAFEAAADRDDPTREDLLPALHMYAHFCEAREFVLSVFNSTETAALLMAAGEVKLRAVAEANLARLKPDWTPQRRRETAVFVAGGFLGLLRWQVENGLKQSPQEMHSAYAAMVRRALVE